MPTGEKAYLVEIKGDGTSATDGTSLFSHCLPKGEGDEVLNPYIETKLHRSMFWQFGKMACTLASNFGLNAPGSSLRRRRELDASGDVSSGESPSPPSSCASYEQYINPAVCEYPAYPSDLTHIPERGDVQDSWYGPLLQIPSVNGEDLNDNSLDAPQHELVIHQALGGVDSTEYTECTISNGDRPATWYPRGVMGQITRGSYLVYRSFQFRNAADRALALSASTDTVNPGLA